MKHIAFALWLAGQGPFPASLPKLDGDAPAPRAAADAAACPDGMKAVVGTHYEQVQRYCLRFDGDNCWNYFPGIVGLESTRSQIAVCMDEYEYPNQKGAMPEVMFRFTEARAKCEAQGKRLCSEFEWELACEGPESRPYPYGWAQEKAACVNEKPYRNYSQKKLSSDDTKTRDGEVKRLYQAEPSGSRERCRSSFGVADLVGNVEEWVATSRPQWAYESSLKGGYWSKPHSACRGTNDSHGPLFRFYEVGFRCCKDL